MLLPSGDHSPPEASVEMLVTLRGSPVSVPFAVSKSCTQICEPPSRDDSNRMRLPSGEKRMRSSPLPSAGVSRRASPPPMGTIHKCGVLVLASRLTSTALKATHLPSGETTGSPTRFSCIMSSKVKGCLFWANPHNEQQIKKKQMRRSMQPPNTATFNSSHNPAPSGSKRSQYDNASQRVIKIQVQGM